MLSFNPEYVTAEAKAALKEKFLTGKPFQSVIIDGFFDPEPLRCVLGEFAEVRHNTSYGDATTQRKFTCDDWALFPPRIYELISVLNSGPFVSWLSDITGITGLTSDPYLHGGGIHETTVGGFLKMHTDFNFHKILRLDRRINVILFLNEGWQPDWGGELVLSDKSFTEVVKVPPVFNRMVIFNTNDHSFHGQPDPHTFPEGNSRKSVAMYYYSNGRPAHEINSHKIGTSYKVRYAGDFPLKDRLRDVVRTLLGRKRPPRSPTA